MTMPTTMTSDEVLRARAVFARDQLVAARHQRTETTAVTTARVLVPAYLVTGLYAVLAVMGHVPAAAWSPLG